MRIKCESGFETLPFFFFIFQRYANLLWKM
jgi:hypothetical protein